MHSFELHTPRLHLRAPNAADIPAVQTLASEWEIARMTLNIPHPYPEDGAKKWIERLESLPTGQVYSFALILKSKDENIFIGNMGIHPDAVHPFAEVGYWVGVPYWGNGYATEALKAIIRFGFEILELHRVYARYFTENPASRRVMEKAGMTYEGTLREHYYRWGVYKDSGICGILRHEWEQRQSQ